MYHCRLTVLQYGLQELLMFLSPLPLCLQFLLFLQLFCSASFSQPLSLCTLVRFNVHGCF